jgi:membrane protease YdiL (CAAX protease family)
MSAGSTGMCQEPEPNERLSQYKTSFWDYYTLPVALRTPYFGTSYLFRDSENAHIATYAGIILGEILLILPAIFILSGRKNIRIRTQLRLNPVPISILLLTVIISIGVTVLADELDRLLEFIIPPPDWVYELMQTMRGEDTVSRFLLFIGVVLTAAITEELLFRGFLQHILEKQWKDITKAVLVTSLFFAVIHFNPWWVIQIYLLGVLLGYLAWRTNSVFPSMIFHGINNGLAFMFANWGEHIDSWYSWKGHVSPLVLIGGTLIAVVGFKRLTEKI